MMIVIENELWPNRLVACHARNVPVAVVGARISQRSAAIWNRFGRLRRATFGSVSWISPQDSASRDRFAALGVPTSCLGTVLNLKSIAELARPDMAEIERFAAFGERGLTLFAASTHEGEEEIILGAFAAARRQLPSLRLILAPRHPRRSDAIGALIDAAGLRYARRSLGGYPDADTFVYLADTLGEMALWYRLAGMTFVGGSLVEKGGHTPFEPVRARSVVLHGPHTANFRSTYEELAEAGAARLVKNADEMTAAVLDLADPDRQDQISKAAQAVVSNDMNRAEMDALVARIFDLAPALRRDTAP